MSALLVLGACSAPGDQGATPAPTESGAAAEGGDLRVVLEAELNLDPVVGARRGAYLWASMLEPVIAVADGQPTGDGIVTGWERTDPTTWEFTVRDGVAFHNGTPVTADEVARSVDLNRQGILAGFMANITAVTATGDSTFTITTTSPQFNIPTLLNSVFLIPADYYAEVGPEGFNAHPVGTGPFMYESSASGRQFIVERNPDYWGAEPHLDSITFTYAPEPAQRLALVQSDSADLAFAIPQGLIADVESDPDLNLLQVATALKVVLAVADREGDLADPQVRQALSKAIDRDGIVEGVLRGAAEPTGALLNVLPADSIAGEAIFDPEGARDLLAGRSPAVTLTVPAGGVANARDIGEAIAGNLQDVGFAVEIETLDYGSMIGQAVGGELTGVFIGPVGGAGTDADFLFRSINAVSSCIEETEVALANEALAADDAAAAGAVYATLNTELVVDDPCVVPLYFEYANFAMSDAVDGFSFSPLTVPDYLSVALTR